jgi:hypothetical protein
MRFVRKLKENKRHAVGHHGTKFLGRNNDGTHKIPRMAWKIVSIESDVRLRELQQPRLFCFYLTVATGLGGTQRSARMIKRTSKPFNAERLIKTSRSEPFKNSNPQ